MNGDRITASTIAARAPQRAAEGLIECTDFAEAICAVPGPAWQVVARHISPDLYCAIFGGLPPSEFLLESWIEDQATASSDYYLSGVVGATLHELNDGTVDKTDLDCLIHILCDRAQVAEPDADIHNQLVDDIPTTVLATQWDPAFGDVRAAQKATKPARTKKTAPMPCPAPTHQLDHTVYAPGTSPASLSFSRDWVHARVTDASSAMPERLRYTITGDCIAVQMIEADGTPGRMLDVAYARLPLVPVITPEGGYLTPQGRMVASIPAYAILPYDGPDASGIGTDAALDMIEITWDAKGDSYRHNPYAVMVETFVSPESPSGETLKNQTTVDIDMDGTPETLTVHRLPGHHLANRSNPDASGQSTNPTGWEADTDDADTAKPHARIRIHHSAIGETPKR